MRVLISGGGIAGLTLAYWLHHYDIPSLVIEQAQGLRRDGYAIDFLGTGYDVAERMNLIDRTMMLALRITRRSTSGRMARCASNSPTRPSGWAWRSVCKKKATPAGCALLVGMCGVG